MEAWLQSTAKRVSARVRRCASRRSSAPTPPRPHSLHLGDNFPLLQAPPLPGGASHTTSPWFALSPFRTHTRSPPSIRLHARPCAAPSPGHSHPHAPWQPPFPGTSSPWSSLFAPLTHDATFIRPQPIDTSISLPILYPPTRGCAPPALALTSPLRTSPLQAPPVPGRTAHPRRHLQPPAAHRDRIAHPSPPGQPRSPHPPTSSPHHLLPPFWRRMAWHRRGG